MASYFSSSNKKGELFELQEDLNSPLYEKKKEAVKKVIAHMTIGKDVSQLFQPVIKCLEFPQLELKKLVYLYIINYSKTKPDDAIMVVSQFDKDIKNKQNPIIRALAVRTMGCVRVPSINTYLAEPLKDSLNDPEPYVRMTAALCIPKVYEVTPDIIENQGLITALQNMLTNEVNAKVMANALIALNEMSYYRGKNLITITPKVLQKMLAAVNDCNEWGQIVMMDYLVNYIPENSKEAEMIVERVLPRLSLINPAVVLGAIKVVIKFMDFITSVDIVKHLTSKITQNLTSLISWHQPQIQYVVLKCVPYLLQKRPGLMEKNIRVFFCNINEPFYIKNEKLDILAKICDNKNYEAVLNEIKEYVNEPDPDFVRRSITSLATIALKFDKAVDKTIDILVEQMKQIRETFRTTEPYVQEIVISMQKIYRKYPAKITQCSSLEVLVSILDLATEEQSKASAAWIIGEFAQHIPKCTELIKARIADFLQEQRGVQLEILTSAIKILIKFPDEGQHFIQGLLEQASYKTENPDVRDRAFIYWRMLSIDTEKVKDTVLCEMPAIQEDNYTLDSDFIDKMIDSLGLICSVYGKTVDELFPRRRKPATTAAPATKEGTNNTSISQNKSPEKSTTTTTVTKPETLKEEIQEPVQSVATAVTSIKPAVVNAPTPAAPVKFDLLDIMDEPAQPVYQQPQVIQPAAYVQMPFSLPPPQQQQQPPKQPQQSFGGNTDLLDMLDDHVVSTPAPVQNIPQQSNPLASFPQQQQQPAGQSDFDLFDSPTKGQNSNAFEVANPIIYTPYITPSTCGKSGKSGFSLEAALINENDQIVLKLKMANQSQVTINDFLLQISPNYFGLKVSQSPTLNLFPGQTVETQAVIAFIGQANTQVTPPTPYTITFAVKTPIDVFIFNVNANITALLSSNGRVSQDEFKTIWKAIPETNKREQITAVANPSYYILETLKEILAKERIFFVANKNENSYYGCKLNGNVVLVEVQASNNNQKGVTISARSQDVNILLPMVQGIAGILQK